MYLRNNIFSNCDLERNITSTPAIHLVRYGSVFLLFFGTIGNLSTIAIFCSKSMPKSKIHTYLLCLLIVDTLIVFISCIRNIWTRFGSDSSGTNINLYDNVPLNITLSILYVYSSWMTVSISVERLLAVCYPFSQRFSTKISNPYFIIVIVAISDIFAHCIIFYFKKHIVYLFTIPVVFYCLIPAACLVLSSIILIYKLFSRPKLGQNSPGSVAARNRNSISIVIAINIVFLLTTFPASLYVFVIAFTNCTIDSTYFVLQMLSIMNSCVNFIMYSIVSKSFRENVKRIFLKKTNLNNRRNIYNIETK